MYSMNVSTGAGHTNDYGNGGNINVTTDQAGEIRIRIASGYTANNLIFKPKLEKGIVVTPYSKYGQGCVKVTKCNNNFFNKNDIVNKAYINSLGEIVSNDGQNYTNYISVVSNAMYTIHAENPLGTAPAVCFYDTNKKFISGFTYNNVKSMSFKTPSNCNFVRASVSSINLETLQIEGGPATTYVQHEEQSDIMPTQQAFKSIGDMRDTFIKKDDKWYERHNINRKKLDGTENWMLVDNNSRFAIKITEQKAKIDVKDSNNNLTDCLSNRFMSSTQLNIAKVDNGIAFSQWSDTQYLYLPKIKDSVDELKSYLAANETYVDYPLETPIDIECTEEQSKILDELNNARTYKNVTNITTDSKAILSLDYFAVTDEKIKNEGNIQSRPILRLEKTVSEAVELTINNVRFKYNFKNEEYVEIDCENKEVTFEGLNRFRNIEIGYEFPKLNVGENKIVMHSGDCIIKVLRKDRWL